MTTLAESLGELTQTGDLDVQRVSLRTSVITNPATGFRRSLKRPLTLIAVRCPEYWVVSDRATLAHGTAPSLSAAVADYMADWQARLEWLEGGEADLAPGVAKELEAYRRLMA